MVGLLKESLVASPEQQKGDPTLRALALSVAFLLCAPWVVNWKLRPGGKVLRSSFKASPRGNVGGMEVWRAAVRTGCQRLLHVFYASLVYAFHDRRAALSCQHAFRVCNRNIKAFISSRLQAIILRGSLRQQSVS